MLARKGIKAFKQPEQEPILSELHGKSDADACTRKQNPSPGLL